MDEKLKHLLKGALAEPCQGITWMVEPATQQRYCSGNAVHDDADWVLATFGGSTD